MKITAKDIRGLKDEVKETRDIKVKLTYKVTENLLKILDDYELEELKRMTITTQHEINI